MKLLKVNLSGCLYKLSKSDSKDEQKSDLIFGNIIKFMISDGEFLHWPATLLMEYVPSHTHSYNLPPLTFQDRLPSALQLYYNNQDQW